MTTISLAEAFVDSDREFWHGVLTGGGFTPIPRWTLDPVPGVAVCEALVPGDLLPTLRKWAAELGVPLSSVLLAAHAKVLAAISGESEVVTGYLAGIRAVALALASDAASRDGNAVEVFLAAAATVTLLQQREQDKARIGESVILALA